VTVALDANLGGVAFNHGATNTGSSGVASWATGLHRLTTPGAVAAGGKIIIDLFLYATPLSGTPTASGGGLTWRVTKGSGDNFTLLRAEADAPSGLASGTVVTISHANSGGGGIAAVSFTGLVTGAANDVYNPSTGGQGANWTIPGLDTTGDGLLYGVTATLANGAGTYNTPTNGATEVHDFGDAGGPVSMATEYKAVTGAGTYSLTGTVRVGQTFNQQLGNSFNAATGGGGTSPSSYSLSGADAVATTDSSGRILSQLRPSASSSLAITESRSRLVSLRTAGSDAQAISEALAGQRGVSSTAGDGVSPSEALSRLISTHKAATDDLGVGSTSLRHVGRTRSASDTLAVGSTPTLIVGLHRSSDDALDASELLTTNGTGTVMSADGIAVSDASSRRTALHAAGTDGSIGVAEGPVVSLALHAGGQDTFLAGDLVQRTVAYARADADSLSLAETILSARGVVVVAADAAGVIDAGGRTANHRTDMIDTLTVVELTGGVVSLLLSATEDLNLSDRVYAIGSALKSQFPPGKISFIALGEGGRVTVAHPGRVGRGRITRIG
jgi:hypothetical protein